MPTGLQKFSINGDKIHPFRVQEGQIVDEVPAGYYKVKECPFTGLYLQRMGDSVQCPDKIYGSAMGRRDRIWDMFNRKDESLGVGLFGKKGAGKTLLANLLAQLGIENGLPVIDVSGSFTTNADYLEFIETIGSCVIIFDEFLKHLSKVNSDEDDSPSSTRRAAERRQDDMLTFFNGTNNAKRLTILIDNESFMLSEYFRDRPSRVRYIYDYDGLETEVVEALAQEFNLSTEKTNSLVAYNRRYACTFDMMNEIMYEWSIHTEESLYDLTKWLNVPTLRAKTTTKCKIVEFKDQNNDIMVENELAETDSDGDVVVNVSRPNPFYNVKKMKRDEWYNSEHYDGTDYSDFLKFREEPRLKEVIYFNDEHLVGIKGNNQAYQREEVSLEIEVLERQTNAQGLDYFNRDGGWAL